MGPAREAPGGTTQHTLVPLTWPYKFFLKGQQPGQGLILPSCFAGLGLSGAPLKSCGAPLRKTTYEQLVSQLPKDVGEGIVGRGAVLLIKATMILKNPI